MNMWRELRRSERGSQMVEFALIAPIMIFLVLCIPMFAIFARSWLVISGAARDGARAASVYQAGMSMAEREQRARNEAAAAIYLDHGPGNSYFDQGRDVTVKTEGNMIVVKVAYHQPTFVPFLARLLDPSGGQMENRARLEATARFWLEKKP